MLVKKRDRDKMKISTLFRCQLDRKEEKKRTLSGVLLISVGY